MRDLLILALATWRLSSLLALEDGPFKIFDRFRIWAGVEYGPYEMTTYRNQFAEMLDCRWCNSVYIGIFWTIAYLISKDVIWVALPFALSAATMALMELEKE